MLFSGLTVAEKNTRLIGFGETEEYLTINNKDEQKTVILKFMGQTYSLNVTNIYKLMTKIKKLRIPNIQLKNKILQNFSIIWFKLPFFQNIQKILATRGL